MVTLACRPPTFKRSECIHMLKRIRPEKRSKMPVKRECQQFIRLYERCTWPSMLIKRSMCMQRTDCTNRLHAPFGPDWPTSTLALWWLAFIRVVHASCIDWYPLEDTVHAYIPAFRVHRSSSMSVSGCQQPTLLSIMIGHAVNPGMKDPKFVEVRWTGAGKQC